tara:strand:+ start:397 stop:540 length:144 start_codon:yes stop_codon:yes gene_type:complete
VESETIRIILLVLFIPIAGFKTYRLIKKLYNLSTPTIKEQLEKIFKT